MIFRGSGSILLGNPIFLWFFRGSGPPAPPPPPSGSAHGMHLKEGTCLKCSFQRVVIIGRKVGLDYNSWYACFAPDQARRTCLQTLIAGRKRRRERERERERLHGVCTRIFFRSVNQSSDEDPKPKLIVRVGFCTAKSDIPQYYM